MKLLQSFMCFLLNPDPPIVHVKNNDKLCNSGTLQQKYPTFDETELKSRFARATSAAPDAARIAYMFNQISGHEIDHRETGSKIAENGKDTFVINFVKIINLNGHIYNSLSTTVSDSVNNRPIQELCKLYCY